MFVLVMILHLLSSTILRLVLQILWSQLHKVLVIDDKMVCRYLYIIHWIVSLSNIIIIHSQSVFLTSHFSMVYVYGCTVWPVLEVHCFVMLYGVVLSMVICLASVTLYVITEVLDSTELCMVQVSETFIYYSSRVIFFKFCLKHIEFDTCFLYVHNPCFMWIYHLQSQNTRETHLNVAVFLFYVYHHCVMHTSAIFWETR